MCLHMYAPCCTSYKRSRPLNMRSNPWIWRSSDLRTSHFGDPSDLGTLQIWGPDLWTTSPGSYPGILDPLQIRSLWS